jgi:hypothetical protein
MSTVREPLLKTVAILDLCPTQMTVGWGTQLDETGHYQPIDLQ